MWSLGSILLELLSGFPLWLSLKSRVQATSGRSVINYGLFGVSGRDNQKIFTKQKQLFSSWANLRKVLASNYDGQCRIYNNGDFMELLRGILDLDPGRRLDPTDVL